MSTSNSPRNTSRLKKITGGREQVSIYLPAEEVTDINKLVNTTGLSRSSIILQRYYLGKKSEISPEGV